MPVKEGSTEVGGPLTKLAEEHNQMQQEFAKMLAEYDQAGTTTSGSGEEPVNEWIVPEKCSLTFTSRDAEDAGDSEWVIPKDPLLRNSDLSVMMNMGGNKNFLKPVDVSFTVIWDGGNSGAQQRIDIKCAGPKPAIQALSENLKHLPELHDRLGRVYLTPEKGSKFAGEPNVGVPSRSLDGGVFRICFYGEHGKHNAAQMVSAHTADELTTKQRCVVYVSDAHKDCMAAAYGLKKEEKADVDAVPLMVDVLPGETLLRALYRDARFDDAMVNRFVATKVDEPKSGNQLTSLGAELHNSTLRLALSGEEEVGDAEAHRARDYEGRVLSRCLAPFLIGKDLGEYKAGSNEGGAEGGDDNTGISGKDYWDMRRTLQEARHDIDGFDVDKVLAELKEELVRTDFDKRTNIAAGKIDPTADAFELINQEKKVNDACEADPICHNGIPEDMQYSLVQRFNSVGVVGCEETAIGGGFRLGSKYLMTCHHMVDAIREMVQKKEPNEGDPPPLEQAHVEFHHYQDELQPMTYTRFSFTADPVYEDPDEDYCILELQVSEDQTDLLAQHLRGLGSLLPPRDASGETEATSSAGKLVKQDDNPTSARSGGQVMFWRSGAPGFDSKGRLTVMSKGTRPMYKNSPTTIMQYVSMAAVREQLYGLVEKRTLADSVVKDMFPLE